MLWAIVVLALAIGGSAYLLDRRDRKHGHKPGSGLGVDSANSADSREGDRPPIPWQDFGSGG